jgi:hypothetical protein
MAAYRTITARYNGACRRCGDPIAAGTKMRYGGRGLTYHLKADCGGAGAGLAGDAWMDRGYGDPVRVSTAYFPSSGDTVYRNARGRCEDAPACGCCTY